MAFTGISSEQAPTSTVRQETGTLVAQTMGLVAVTAGLFAVGAYVARDSSASWGWVWLIGSFACLLGMGAATRRSDRLAILLLFAFGTMIGVGVSPTLTYYAASDPAALWEAGAATALFVAGFGAAGYATRRDLSSIARYLTWGLVAVIALGVVLIFVQIPHGALVYSILGLVVFAGLTAYDFQRLKQANDGASAPLLAASIFLDILNVFLLMLSLFGGSRN